MELLLTDTSIQSVFELNGTDENSATKALCWVMKKCPSLCEAFALDTYNLKINPKDTILHTQAYASGAGFTDIEIRCPNIGHIIVEAKIGWTLPNAGQFTKYTQRFNSTNGVFNGLVSLSAASQAYASSNQPSKISNYPLVHRSWDDIQRLAQATHYKTKSHEEKLWLHQLDSFLGGYVQTQNTRSNEAYVVSLSKTAAVSNPKYTFVDVVTKDSSYFHPVGNTWPVIPPNYIAFRYDGKVQSIHHIESHKVVRDLSSENPNWPVTNKDHFVYKLGPAMIPIKPVLSEQIRAMRVMCAIDTLLSGKYKTVRQARDETDRRNENK